METMVTSFAHVLAKVTYHLKNIKTIIRKEELYYA